MEVTNECRTGGPDPHGTHGPVSGPLCHLTPVTMWERPDAQLTEGHLSLVPRRVSVAFEFRMSGWSLRDSLTQVALNDTEKGISCQ